VAPQSTVQSKPPISTAERVRLYDHAVRELSFSVDPFERKLVRSVVDFMTGSNLVTVQRFLPTYPIKLDELEREQVQAIVNAVFGIVTDPEFPYEANVIDDQRCRQLMDLVADNEFDVVGCKDRILALMREGRPLVFGGERFEEEGFLEAAIAFLTGSDMNVSGLHASITHVEEGRYRFSVPSVEQLHVVKSVMEKRYPSAVDAERKELLIRAFAQHEAYIPSAYFGPQ